MRDSDLENYFHKEINKIRRATFIKSDQLSLEDLIEQFEALELQWGTHTCEKGKAPKQFDKTVHYDFGQMIPDGMHSYRGSYREFAIGYKELDYGTKHVSAVDFLKDLKSVVGKSYQGWKGGHFVMFRETPVWIAQDGDSVNSGVVGVQEDATQIIILTAYCEF